MAFVIGISAPPGGGKSSLAQALAKRLGNATTIHFDAYEQITSSPMHDISDWMRRGADFNEFDIQKLSEDLKRIKSGQSITESNETFEILPPHYVLFETLFGREHEASGRFIDRLIWIDVPLDLALARKLLDFTDPEPDEGVGQNADSTLMWLRGYLGHYVQATRGLLMMQKERIALTADLTLNGTLDLTTLVEQATRDILDHLG